VKVAIKTNKIEQ